jgi:hypothetical protein
MREHPRRRHQLAPGIAPLIWPIFRFSHPRQAYVLRGVGNRIGPVLFVNRTAERRRITR